MKFTAVDEERVRGAAHSAMEDLHLPGASIGVVSGDALVYAEGFGYADVESGRRHDPAARHRIGSITKTMTGLCVMALIDEGKLRLDDRLIDHITELSFDGDGAAITVRHLLTHTSGIAMVNRREDIFDPNALLDSETRDDKDALALFPNGITLEVPPGTKWCYANLGFALLGEIVARIEGAPIAEVMARRVFAPLGMSNSDLLDEPHPDLSTPYHATQSQESIEYAIRKGQPLKHEAAVDGHNVRGHFRYLRGAGAYGAVQSNVPDMARYASALLRNGAGIVRPQTFEAMTAAQWSPDERLISSGFAFERCERFGARMFGHNGWSAGDWSSVLLIIPTENLALIIHANMEFDRCAIFGRRVLAALLDAAPVTLRGEMDEATLTAAPGVYSAIPGPLTNVWVSFNLGRLQIKAVEGALMLHSRYGPWRNGVRLRPGDLNDLNFLLMDDNELEPSHLRLLRDASGSVTGLRCDRLIQMVRSDHVAPWVV